METEETQNPKTETTTALSTGNQIAQKFFPKDVPGFSNTEAGKLHDKLAKDIDEKLKTTWEAAQNSFIDNEYEQSSGGPWHHTIETLNTLKTPYKPESF